MKPQYLHAQLQVLILILGLYLSCANAQIVSLRDPTPFRPGHTTTVGGQQISKFVAKPGDVVVHFDKNHDIQKLHYVLQDGHLATLYQRRLPSSNKTPVQVPAGSLMQRRAEGSNPGTRLQDQTIDILNSKMQQVSHIIGDDHVTVVIPDRKGGSSNGASGSVGEAHELPFRGLPSREVMDILATVAVDTSQAAGVVKPVKTNIILNHLKNKVTQKLRELPGIIDAKLRAKSSAGQIFLDRASNRIVAIEDTPNGPIIIHQPNQSGNIRQPPGNSFVLSDLFNLGDSNQASSSPIIVSQPPASSAVISASPSISIQTGVSQAQFNQPITKQTQVNQASSSQSKSSDSPASDPIVVAPISSGSIFTRPAPSSSSTSSLMAVPSTSSLPSSGAGSSQPSLSASSIPLSSLTGPNQNPVTLVAVPAAVDRNQDNTREATAQERSDQSPAQQQQQQPPSPPQPNQPQATINQALPTAPNTELIAQRVSPE